MRPARSWLVVAVFVCSLSAAGSGCGGRGKKTGGKKPTTPSSRTTRRDRPAPPKRVLPEEGAPNRLPTSVTPLDYELRLTILPERPSFSGEVRIKALLSGPRKKIFLHGRGLRVTSASVRLPNGKRATARYTQVAPDGRARLDLPGAVGPGRVTIEVAYTGEYGKRLRGIYRVKDGGRHYVFTHFQPSAARRCFPGFDEPGFKTPFDISLVVKAGDAAVANSPVAKVEKLSGGLKRVRFRRTARLPTYLVALAVGPFDVVAGPPIPANSVRKTPLSLRGIATRGKGPRLAYALKNTGGILVALERYFGIPYPYAKLDVIAVPDFEPGAMENAGAITFAEPYLLLDPRDASEKQRQGFAYVMAHEVAHQWFGNLVTMRWWDDTWLSEAFATWIGNRAVDTWRPSYRRAAVFLGRVFLAMKADSLASARQIRQPILSAHDVVASFDLITYFKGGSVLAMFERYLGPRKFRAGLRRYLNQYRFGNASADDLLRTLEQVARKGVAAPFRTFLLQPGVPLVQVRSRCVGGRARVSLTQQRYLPLGSTAGALGIWQIPICLRFGEGARRGARCLLLKRRQEEVTLPTCPDWIHPNAGGAGYLRFELPRADLDRLVKVAAKHLDTQERLSLADSIQAAVDRGKLDPGSALTALATLARSGDPFLVAAPVEMLRWTHDHLLTKKLRPRLQAWVRDLYRDVFRRLGFSPRPGEDPQYRAVRQQVIVMLGRYGREPTVRAEAKRRAAAYLGFGKDGALHRDAVDPDLVSTVLAIGLEELGVPYFEALRKHLLRSTDAQFRSDAVGALAAAWNPDVTRRARNLAVGSSLRINEVAKFVTVHLLTQRDPASTWSWFETELATLGKRLPVFLLGRLPLFLRRACDVGLAKRVNRFLGPKVARFPGGPRSLRQAVELITLCVHRARAHRESAIKYFEAQKM